MMVFGFGVAVVVLLLGFQFLDKGEVKEEIVGEEKTSEVSTPKTLLDLVAMGNEVMCSYSYADEDGDETEGEVFVAGGKTRSNYKAMMADGKATEGSAITDGEYSYVWGSGMEDGIKVRMRNEAEEPNEATVTSEYVQPDRAMDYRCDPWTPDSSVFMLPENVEFRDLDAMMERTRSSQCGACAMLEGEAKATCEKQLGC